MNIYQKLQQARVKLQSTSLKKTGNNKFAGYDYFELGDFLPAINQIMNEIGLASYINFNPEMAVLTMVNVEKPEEMIQFTSPMATAQLKGCHDVQNLGAVQTYLRRYLYVNAFEIVEHDALDAITGDASKTSQNAPGSTESTGQPNTSTKGEINEKQIKRLYAIANSKGIKADAVKKTIMKDYNKTSAEELTKTEYDALCERLEKAVAKS